MNLTAITEPAAIEVRHFLDSLSVFKAVDLPSDARVIDVGTGAGFPGLPLKIVRPDLQLTLLEATGKKTTFLSHIVELLDLNAVEVVTARAEDAGQDPVHRERYDLVLARAVAQLPILVEYMLPFVKIGGKCLALKGQTAAEELIAAERAIRTLGGKADRIVRIDLPAVAEPHYLIVIDKVAPTPANYPRRTGIPAKKPLL